MKWWMKYGGVPPTGFDNALSTQFQSGSSQYGTSAKGLESQFDGTNDATASIWMRKASATTMVPFASWNNGASPWEGFGFFWASGGAIDIRLGPQSGNYYRDIVAFGAALDTWYHYCVHIHANALNAPNGMDHFIDGTQIVETNNRASWVSASNFQENMHYGAAKSGASQASYMDGYIDEISFFDGHVSASTLYNSGAPGDLTSLNPLVWYRCGDSDTAGTWTDHGSVGENVTLVNSPTFESEVP